MRISLLLISIFCSNALHAQSDWLPPIAIKNASIVTDTTPYKLVFFDDFDGNSLDTNNWNTYVSWAGMSRSVSGKTISGDHQYWRGARLSNGFQLFTDENVIVKDGMCQLLNRNQSYTWDCVGCTDGDTSITTKITAGMIATPYYKKPDGTRNYYSNGRFEARMRLPVHAQAWVGMWTWFGTRVDELDIVEAYGAKPRWGKIVSPLATHNYHAWGYHSEGKELPHQAIENNYPNQNWWQMLNGTAFRQQDWHIYTCEWDTASIKIYLDRHLVNTLYKYYQDDSVVSFDGFKNRQYNIKRSADSALSPGEWKIPVGYPYANDSKSHLRITSGFLSAEEAIPDTTFTLGSVDIDYVRIWQRHPAVEGHKVLEEVALSESFGKFSDILEPQDTNIYILRSKSPVGNLFSFWAGTALGKSSMADYTWRIGYRDKRGRYKNFEQQGAFVSLPGMKRRRDLPTTINY